METLKEVCTVLNNIPNINQGGCGIAALTLYKWLEKKNQLADDTRIIYFYYDYRSNIAINRSNKFKTLPAAPYHAVLYHKGCYIDSNDMNYISTHKYSQKIKNIKFVIESINNNTCNWNSSFDRNSVKDIESTLDIDLKLK